MIKVSINEICCYCGVREATTRDHIPPKSIFNKPRPSDLITVPCCFECNNKASTNDEKFKTYLGLHVGKKGGENARLFQEGVLPTVKHNKKLGHSILTQMRRVEDGNITVLWDSEVHDITIERITRGLLFYHYGKIINSNIDIYWFDEPVPDMDNDFLENSIANGAFSYKYYKDKKAKFATVWQFTFYNSHFAGSIVQPIS